MTLRHRFLYPRGASGCRQMRTADAAPLVLPGNVAPRAANWDGGLRPCLADLLTWLEAMNEDRLGADTADVGANAGKAQGWHGPDHAWRIGPRPWIGRNDVSAWRTVARLLRHNRWLPGDGHGDRDLVAPAEDISTISTAALKLHAELVAFS